jgi:lysophospholipase L1-like esterase
MKHHRYCLLLFIAISLTNLVPAQDRAPFSNDILQFRKSDSAAFPAAGQVLFIGSSSFTNWRDVNDYFPGVRILNRAFGGSSLPDLIRYRYQAIFPYRPRQIVIYCGENDFAASDTVTVDIVLDRFRSLYGLIRAWDPKVPLLYVSMKPSPSRAHLMQKYTEANRRIREIMEQDRHGDYADVYTKMLKPDGTPMDDIFGPDRLHMTAKGYAIWKDVLKKKLK